MKQKILVSMLIAGGFLAPAAYATNGYFSHGYGIKSEGMGGVGIAFPQDSLAAATNPAGMVMVGNRMDLGLEWFKPSRSAQITGSPVPGANGTYDANGKTNFFIPNFGYNRMISSDSSLGVSVYGNGGMNTTYTTANPLLGASPAMMNLEQLFVAPTFSMKVDDKNYFGISLNLAYQRFKAQGLENFTAVSQTPTGVTNNGTDTSMGYGLHLGWIQQVTPNVSVGATYQTKTKMGKFNKYAGLFANQGSFDIPATYGAGIAVKVAPPTTVAFDVQRIMYNDVPSIANPNPTGQLGSANGTGFGWQNMTVYKLGVSHDVNQNLTLRAGWDHNNVAIPQSQTYFNIIAPATVTDHLTLGGTWKLADKSEISFYYMHAFRKTIYGNGSLAGAGGGESNLTLSEDSLGVSYGWNL